MLPISPVHGSGDEVESPCAQIADKSQHVEQVTGVKRVHLALHAEAGEEHHEHRRHQQQPANPAALNEVSEAGQEPSRDRGDNRHRIFAGAGCLRRTPGHSCCILRIRHQTCTNSFCIAAGDFALTVADHHVDLAAHSEFRQVDSGLDREAGVGQNLAIVFGLEVIQVRTVGVNVAADRMSRAMDKVLSIALAGDMVRGPLRPLPSLEFSAWHQRPA